MKLKPQPKNLPSTLNNKLLLWVSILKLITKKQKPNMLPSNKSVKLRMPIFKLSMPRENITIKWPRLMLMNNFVVETVPRLS